MFVFFYFLISWDTMVQLVCTAAQNFREKWLLVYFTEVQGIFTEVVQYFKIRRFSGSDPLSSEPLLQEEEEIKERGLSRFQALLRRFTASAMSTDESDRALSSDEDSGGEQGNEH